MKKEFVMRGQTASGSTEVLNFSGYKPGYAYRLVEFQLYPSEPNNNYELNGTLTAGKTAIAPTTGINFNDAGLIATSWLAASSNNYYAHGPVTVINDTFLITQNLILMVQTSLGSDPVNWQCRFVSVKMNDAEEATTNFKQFTISDG